MRTQPPYRFQIVTHEDDRPPFACHIVHLAKAALLEGRIANGEYFIDQQDFRLQVCRNRKRQPQVHATGIVLHRRVDERARFGEPHDRVEPRLDFGTRHSENRPVQEDVLPSGQLGVEAGAHFQQ